MVAINRERPAAFKRNIRDAGLEARWNELDALVEEINQLKDNLKKRELELFRKPKMASTAAQEDMLSANSICKAQYYVLMQYISIAPHDVGCDLYDHGLDLWVNGSTRAEIILARLRN